MVARGPPVVRGDPVSVMPVDVPLLRAAALIARDSSHDLRTQNAAVIACQAEKVVTAANTYPVASWNRHAVAPEKYTYIEHAERAAVYVAASLGVSCDGGIMYCPWFACPDCARAIIAAGISTVVGLSKLRAITPGRWRQQIATADRMLEDAGVEVRMVDELLGVTLRFDGREVDV